MAGTQMIEDFWGGELSKSKKELKWTEEDDGEGDPMFTEKTLELRQACLGASAKPSERNVVELTTDDQEGEPATHTLLSMSVGGTEQCPLFLTLQPPVTFKLVQGSGPIHIIGQVTETISLDMLDDSDGDDSEGGEEEEEEVNGEKEVSSARSQKRPASSQPKAPAKVSKLAADGDVKDRLGNGEELDDDDDDEDEDDDSDEGEGEGDDDDEEEDDEMEEETAKPPPKKSQNKKAQISHIATPHPKTKPGTGFKTPQPPKSASKQNQKRSQSAPGTPKSEKKKGQGKEVSDLTEIKQRLTKMSVPKKLEKFNNFISNSFKIKDDSIKKQLWEFMQKNRPQP